MTGCMVAFNFISSFMNGHSVGRKACRWENWPFLTSILESGWRTRKGERRILIGAPNQGTTGALYNCDEYSSHCKSYYSDALYQNSSMFGSSVKKGFQNEVSTNQISAQSNNQSESALQFENHLKWINDDLFISCEPRFTEYSKCYRMEGKKNIQCKRHGHFWPFQSLN